MRASSCRLARCDVDLLLQSTTNDEVTASPLLTLLLPSHRPCVRAMESLIGTDGGGARLSVQDHQRAVIELMLSACASSPDVVDDGSDVWKVLIYDSSAREIIAPLLRVADLRARGVTLHMMLHAARHPIPDVPAVYLIAPTKENVQRICADSAKGMYASLWVNFTSRVSRELLEALADGVAAAPAARQTNALVAAPGAIVRVYDMYADFLTLEHNLFSLNLPGIYTRLTASRVSNADVEARVNTIVDKLFCAVVTLAAVPIIRAQPGGPAQLVATLLERRIREHLIASNNIFSESAGSFSATAATRPLLVIIDRSIDLSVMLHHTWTYQALAHDTLGLKLNRVSVPVKDSTGGVPGMPSPMKKRVFDLDKSDVFWAENAGLPFPLVAEAVETSLQKYKDEVAELNRTAGTVGDNAIDPMTADVNDENTANKLAAAISSIPELTKKKRMIDLHTNIATALLDQIKDRGLDGYFQVEEELLLRPGTFDVERVLALLRDARGTPTDKLRLFLIYYLCVDSATEDELSRCTSTLQSAGCTDLRAYSYLKSIRAFTKSISSVPAAPLTSSSSIGSGYAASVLDTLSQVANNVNKLIISADKALSAARVVQTLMDQKGDTEILEGYLTLDPKAPKGSASSVSGARPAKEAILFVVGPGNYIEYQNCQDHVCSIVKQDGKKSTVVPNGKTLIYGATELCTGVEFLEQLHTNGGPKPSSVQNGAKVPT